MAGINSEIISIHQLYAKTYFNTFNTKHSKVAKEKTGSIEASFHSVYIEGMYVSLLHSTLGINCGV